MRRLKLIITGQVQGVGFRSYVKTNIDRLNSSSVHNKKYPAITGYVRNVPDGDVEIVLEGSEEDLEYVLRLCWLGPRFGQIEGIKEEWEEAEGKWKEFQIERT